MNLWWCKDLFIVKVFSRFNKFTGGADEFIHTGELVVDKQEGRHNTQVENKEGCMRKK